MFSQCVHFRNVFALTIALGLGATGCATKKYVAKTVNPVEQRVTQVEKRSAEQGKTLDTVETDLSKTKERVLDLDANLKQTNDRVNDVSTRTDQAGAEATKAQQQAADARTQASEARTHADARTDQLKTYVDALDTFKMTRSSNVLFSTGKSTLDAEAKSTLDEIARVALANKKFAFEVQGFTDSQGPASLNLVLSQQRAETVVRYLTSTAKVPLRNVHLIGAGSDSPVGSNRTREGRRQNRRVEVRLFAPEVDGASAVTSAQLR